MTGSSQLPGHAFISYVHEDSPRVDQLQQALQAAGVRVWRDTSDLWPGEDWRTKIRRAISEDALAFLACFSSSSLARKASYQNEELLLAIDQMRMRRPDEPWLIPVRFDEVDVPDIDLGGGRTLASLQSADLFGAHSGQGMSRVVQVVLRILGPAVPGGASDNAPGPIGRPLAAHRLTQLVHQILLAGSRTKDFHVTRPGEAPTKLLRQSGEIHQLEPGEEILAAWLKRWGLFSRAVDCLVFTTAGIRIASPGMRLHIPYQRLPEYRFQERKSMERVNRHSRAGGPTLEEFYCLSIEGDGHEWTSVKEEYRGTSSIVLAHLNTINLLIKE
jgi:hypothetical protein